MLEKLRRDKNQGGSNGIKKEKNLDTTLKE